MDNNLQNHDNSTDNQNMANSSESMSENLNEKTEEALNQVLGENSQAAKDEPVQETETYAPPVTENDGNVPYASGEQPSANPENSQNPQTPVDPENPEQPKKKKKLAAVLTTVGIVLVLVLAAAGFGVYSYFSFPDFDNAMEKSLDGKLLPDTEFDFAKLAEEGRVTLNYDNGLKNGSGKSVTELDFSYKDATGSIAVTNTLDKEKTSVSVDFDNEKVALKSDSLDESYGISLENFRKNAEKSIFAPDSGSEYAWSEEEFEQICNFIEQYISAAEKGKSGKESSELWDLVSKTFKRSSISEYERFYGELKLDNDSRRVKSQTYQFNSNNVSKFIRNLASDLKANKSNKELRREVEMLASLFSSNIPVAPNTSGFAVAPGAAAQNVVYEFDDVIDFLQELADTVEAIDFSVTAEICYAGRAVSLILVEGEMDIGLGMEASLNLTVDFGAKPLTAGMMMLDFGFVMTGPENLYNRLDLKLEVEKESDRKNGTSGVEYIVDVFYDKGKGDNGSFGLSLGLEFDRKEEEFNAHIKVKDAGKITFGGTLKDTKDEFSITFDSMKAGTENMMTGKLALSFVRDSDMKAPSYKNDILKLTESEWEAFEKACTDDMGKIIDGIGIGGIEKNEPEDDIPNTDLSTKPGNIILNNTISLTTADNKYVTVDKDAYNLANTTFRNLISKCGSSVPQDCVGYCYYDEVNDLMFVELTKQARDSVTERIWNTGYYVFSSSADAYCAWYLIYLNNL